MNFQALSRRLREQDDAAARVCGGGHAGRDDELDLALGHGRAAPRRPRRRGAHVDALAGEVAARQPRQAQEIIDHPCHALGGGTHPVKTPQLVGREALGGVLDEDLAEAVDGAQRGTQVVGGE